MKPSEATDLIAILVDAFPKATIANNNATTYADFIKDLPYETTKQAIYGIIATATFFPSIAEIRAAVNDAVNPAKSAEEAYTELNEKVRLYGHYGVPRPDGGYDPVPWSSTNIAAAIETIGYLNICQTPEKQDRILFAQFRDAYNNLATRSREQSIVAPLLAKPLETPKLPPTDPSPDTRKFLI